MATQYQYHNQQHHLQITLQNDYQTLHSKIYKKEL